MMKEIKKAKLKIKKSGPELFLYFLTFNFELILTRRYQT